MIIFIDDGGGAPPPAASYWNPADKNPGITLSDDNKLASGTGGAWMALRSAQSHNSGKRYAEFVYVAGTNWAVIAGLARSTHALSQFPGESSASWGLQCWTSGVNAQAYYSSSGIGTVAQITPGEIIRLSVDFDAGQFWLGNSAAYVGGGDPEAGTSPTAIFTPGTTLFLAGGLYSSGPQLRVRTISAEFTGTKPPSFAGWCD